jgi:hypothetical protein
MREKIKITIFLLFLIPGFLLAQKAKKYNVDEVRIRGRRDSTFITILTSGKPTYNTFFIDMPPRLGVDFTHGVINLPRTEYGDMPPGIIASVRAAQFKTVPKLITRVVFDLVEVNNRIHVYRIPNGVKISISTPIYPEFAEWTSGRLKPLPSEKPEEEYPPAEVEIPAVAPTAEESLLAAQGEILAELAEFLKPETLVYQAVTMHNETLSLATYIRNLVFFRLPPRDPFATPTTDYITSIGEEPIPLLENLTLVGIVKSGDFYFAVFRDRLGYSYVMTPGDSIVDGIVTDVNDTSTVFTIVEFGQPRKIIIPISQED